MFMLIIGAILTAASMASTYSAARSQSKALAKESVIKAQERAKRTKSLAAKQKASFLHSGISLTGEGTPQSFFDETFDTGSKDINLIKENYDAQIKNVMGGARTKMISQLGTFAVSAGVGGMMSGAAGAGSSSSGVVNSGFSNANVGGNLGAGNMFL